jgi:cephalosporin hydroxylase
MKQRLARLFFRVVNYLKPAPVRVYLNPAVVLNDVRGQDIVEQFNDLYYRLNGSGFRWRGRMLIKNPCDLWTYFEMIREIRPRVIIEAGTAEGGSALWFADTTASCGLSTEIITIDINPKLSEAPPRVHSLIGRSVDARIVQEVGQLLERFLGVEQGPVMVFLDSDHTKANVLEELKIYSRFVTVGSYMVVEDSNINGHPSFPDFGPGPYEAIMEFASSTEAFVIDREREKLLLTFNPCGYLRCVHK